MFARDKTGALAKRLGECVDGDMQTAYVRGAAYLREFLFNTDELKALVADYSDEQLAALGRGAHDHAKIYAAYQAATTHTGQPTVILTQGVKGYGLGTDNAEGRNIAHNALEMSVDELKVFRDRFKLPLTDAQVESLSYYVPAKDSAEMKYMQARRQVLGGYLPAREAPSAPLAVPALTAYDAVLQGSGDRTMSTTMSFGRILNVILKDKTIHQALTFDDVLLVPGASNVQPADADTTTRLTREKYFSAAAKASLSRFAAL